MQSASVLHDTAMRVAPSWRILLPVSFWRIAIVLPGVIAVACVHAPPDRPSPPPVDWGSFPSGDQHAPASAPTSRERDAAGSYVTALMSPQFVHLASVLAPDASG